MHRWVKGIKLSPCVSMGNEMVWLIVGQEVMPIPYISINITLAGYANTQCASVPASMAYSVSKTPL